MQIKRIKTSAFRKFKNTFETKLYDVTSITGKNTSGKTNILYAIIWAFLGSNLTGDERVWLGNFKTDKCFVEVEFSDNNGTSHTLVRSKDKYDNKKSFILLDDKKVKQEDLINFYHDKKLFLSIVNPNYFTSKKPAEQKELLDKYLPDIHIIDAYNKLEDDDKNTLEIMPSNILDYMQELRDTKKLNEDKIKHLRGKIEYAEGFANYNVEEKKVFSKGEELLLAREELSFLISDKNLVNKEKQQNIVNQMEFDIKNLEDKVNKLSMEMAEGKKKYLIIKNSISSKCPMCEQDIKDKTKQLTISKMYDNLDKMFNERKEIEAKITDLKISLNQEKCKLYAIHDDVEIACRLEEVKEQIEILEKEKSEIDKINSEIEIKLHQKNGAISDIETFRLSIDTYRKSIENIEQAIKVTQKLYINYIEEKMKYATKYLKDVSIKFYSILKESGELKVDFIITYKGTEFKNLSKSESIAASLELCNMLNRISGVNLPIFIDDTESCADYDFIEEYSNDNQILIASVAKGQELVISDYKTEKQNFIKAA